MARFNEILAGRYNRFLQKLFAMKGGPPVPQLGGEIMPNLPLFSGAENRYLEQWDRFWIAMSVTGGAAQQAATRIRNPGGSGVLAVIEKITVAAPATLQQVQLQQQTTGADLTGLLSNATLMRMDARGRRSPTCVISTTTNYAAGPQANGQCMLNVGVSYDFIFTDSQEITLLPGDDVTVFDGTVNVQLLNSIMWRERAMEESELK